MIRTPDAEQALPAGDSGDVESPSAPEAASANRSQVWLLFVVAFVSVLTCIYATRSYVMDDSMITLRYSFHLATLGRAIYNPADLPRHDLGYGYTSILWMLINTVPAFVTQNKDALVETARLLLLAPLGVIAYLFVSRISKLGMALLPKIVTTLAIFSLALYGFHANSAMETVLYCCFVLLCIVSYSEDRISALPYIFAILAFLTRPEGGILVALVCLEDMRRGRFKRAILGGLALAVVVAIAAMLLKQTYGHFLPDSFYVKQQSGVNWHAAMRTGYFLLYVALPFVVLSAISVYYLKNTASRLCWYVALVFLAYYTTINPLMNHLFRNQFSALVLLTYGSLPAIELLAQNWKRWKYAGALLLLVVAYINFTVAAQASAWASVYGTEMRNYTIIGKAMYAHPMKDRWLVCGDGGAIPYYSEWNTCEVWGLTDYRLAVTPMLTLHSVLRNPATEIVMILADYKGRVPAPTDGRLVLNFAHAIIENSRLKSVTGFEVANDFPVVVEGRDFYALRVLARDPQAAETMFSGMRLAPDRPVGNIEQVASSITHLLGKWHL